MVVSGLVLWLDGRGQKVKNESCVARPKIARAHHYGSERD